jgi:hypothetical protein
VFFRLINRPSWLIFGGFAIQAFGAGVGSEAWWGHDQYGEVYRNSTGAVVGALIGWVGFWIMVVGLIALAVKYVIPEGAAVAAAAAAALAAGPADVRSPRVAPAQNDPAEVASDPTPFIPHDSDSSVIAEVRRACGRGSRRSTVQRIINKASREGRLTEHDRDMAEAILVEAIRRPLGPVSTNI